MWVIGFKDKFGKYLDVVSVFRWLCCDGVCWEFVRRVCVRFFFVF